MVAQDVRSSESTSHLTRRRSDCRVARCSAHLFCGTSRASLRARSKAKRSRCRRSLSDRYAGVGLLCDLCGRRRSHGIGLRRKGSHIAVGYRRHTQPECFSYAESERVRDAIDHVAGVRGRSSTESPEPAARRLRTCNDLSRQRTVGFCMLLKHTAREAQYFARLVPRRIRLPAHRPRTVVFVPAATVTRTQDRVQCVWSHS